MGKEERQLLTDIRDVLHSILEVLAAENRGGDCIGFNTERVDEEEDFEPSEDREVQLGGATRGNQSGDRPRGKGD